MVKAAMTTEIISAICLFANYKYCPYDSADSSCGYSIHKGFYTRMLPVFFK
jgi:hypothetical protein